jgi:hypothetical protein
LNRSYAGATSDKTALARTILAANSLDLLELKTHYRAFPTNDISNA